tara:strand:+ start:798 stop:956 length:159 start_codon:yes stop_codon:yes gene_type:complete
MAWTPEEREAWLRRAAKKMRESEAEADRLAAPLLARQWSRWQREEQDEEQAT